jgi:uncharacterized protein involved in response to NO
LAEIEFTRTMTMSQARHSEMFRSRPGATVRPSLDAFFSYGFRPFFLGAAVYAALLMTVWIAWIATSATGTAAFQLPVAGSPYAWHAHEFVFGFAMAAVAGFLLTAVPNWTGALPLSGAPLVVLFLVWIAGRVVMAVSGLLPQTVVATTDLSFLPLLGVFAARQLLVKPAPRNIVFLVILLALTLVNLAFHLATAGVISWEPLTVVRVGLMAVAIIIAIIGGRIIPAFTHNWLHLNGVTGPMPRRIDWLDRASILSLVTFVMLQALAVPPALIGGVALLASAINGTRLYLWRGWATRSEPIVFILHLGYAWIVAGLLLSAVNAWTDAVPASLASHAFGTGAAGTMILAVMTRASLGHTGRSIVAPRAIVWAYVLVSFSALMRVAGPLVASQYSAVVLSAAALAWIAAFTLFAAVYAPILTTTRVHTKVSGTRL